MREDRNEFENEENEKIKENEIKEDEKIKDDEIEKEESKIEKKELKLEKEEEKIQRQEEKLEQEEKKLQKEQSEIEKENLLKEKRKKAKETLDGYINSAVENEYRKIRRSKKTSFLKMIVAMLVVSFISSGATGFYFSKKYKNNDALQKDTTQAININTKENVNVETAVAKKAMPSVVGITTVSVTEDMFTGQREVKGLGSGVIVGKEGYIVTNNHVIDPTKTKKTTVLLHDGSKHDAEVLWSDKTLDLAVIKIDAKGLNLTPIELGDSSTINIGNKAIAIGNPLGINLKSTLTSGYISGKDRVISLQDGSTMEGLLQTDAAINPGNSGGALLNSKGELIGINTAKAGNSDGIGFAIPINTAKPILEKIIKNGTFETVVLGIRGIDVSKYNVLSENKLEAKDGVYVHEVISGSPADEGKMKKGDIITKVGDHKVTSNSNLKTALLNYTIGDEANIEVNRNGKIITLKINFSKFN